jgi:hypothetical protein
MFLRVRDSHSRSILNAVSWRVTGSIDTFAPRWRYSKGPAAMELSPNLGDGRGQAAAA